MPRTINSWRCRMDLPTLTEDEWALLRPQLDHVIEQINRYRIASIGHDRYALIMSTVHEIEDAIRKLPELDLVALRAWFAEFDATAWDRQFERDVAEGRPDALAQEALRDAREGRCTDR
jgi:hypothetical protein